MYKRILLPTDGSDIAVQACRHGIRLAKAVNAKICILYVSPPLNPASGYEFFALPPMPLAAFEESAKAVAKRHLQAIESLANRAGLNSKSLHRFEVSPADAISEVAATEKCDLIVMGSHGRGSIKQLLVGSVTTRVLASCVVPVLVHRGVIKKQKAE